VNAEVVAVHSRRSMVAIGLNANHVIGPAAFYVELKCSHPTRLAVNTIAFLAISFHGKLIEELEEKQHQ
jgi:hypothetical protein